MINPGGKLLNAWFDLLNGNLSLNSTNIPVFRTDADSGWVGDYVLLRMESSTDRRNNSQNVTNPILITDVVTKYDAMINDADVFDIDSQIGQLLSSNAATHNLPAQSGIQIVSVIRQGQTVLAEDDGTFRYNRLITRNAHRVLQT